MESIFIFLVWLLKDIPKKQYHKQAFYRTIKSKGIHTKVHILQALIQVH